MTGQGSPHTVVVGFDALSRRYLDAFDLPNFESLRRQGVEATLEATFPPWTGSAWPSLYTGTDPSHHGVFSFFDFRDTYPDGADLATRDVVAAPAIWNYLSAQDARNIVLNVPLTHPAEAIDGVLVPGYLAPEGTPGHPPDIQEELSETVGEPYRIYEDGLAGSGDGDSELERHRRLVDLRRRAAVHLLEDYEAEFAFLQVQKTDSVFHNFDDREAHRLVYEVADAFLGSVLESVDDDTNVVVCSDHGIGPVTGYKIYVNEVLCRHGLVETTPDGSTANLQDEKARIVEGTSRDGGDGEEAGAAEDGRVDPADEPTPDLATRAVGTAGGLLDAVGISPGDVYAVASRLGVADPLIEHIPVNVGDTVGRQVDWRRSVAYCRNRAELGVRVNLAGRDPDGVVPPDAYDRVRDRLLGILRGLETPDGRPAFDWVKPREAVYDGPNVEHACDVLFRPRSMDNVVATSLLGRTFVPVETYEHNFEGVLLAAGPAFETDVDVGRCSLDDVAPTVMAALDRSVPDRMTGGVPPQLLRHEVRRADYGPVQYGTDGDGASGGQVERRLEDLGYL